MKAKTLKIVITLLMAIFTVCTVSQVVLASDETTATGVLDQIETNIKNPDSDATGKLSSVAGSILGLIRVASAVAAVILIAIFGFKFIMGSANEKADYQKSFIPLIVGVVVVFSATYIAELLFTTFA